MRERPIGFWRCIATVLAMMIAAPLAAAETAPKGASSDPSPHHAGAENVKITMPVGSPIAHPKIAGEILLRDNLRDWASSAGEQWELFMGERTVRNVTRATLTPILPDPAKATGAAVVVVPGGAFLYLGIDGEGFDVARRLADRGIAAFVLKYRTVPTSRDPQQHVEQMLTMLNGIAARRSENPLAGVAGIPEAVEDGQAAIRLVRSRAVEWRLDPERVGMVGFSAGAITSLKVATAPDAAARPDFVASIYGPADIGEVPGNAPPLFAAMAMDDQYASANSGGLMTAWARAGRPVEAHFHEGGGHGFSSEAVREKYFAELFSWMEARKLILRSAAAAPTR